MPYFFDEFRHCSADLPPVHFCPFVFFVKHLPGSGNCFLQRCVEFASFLEVHVKSNCRKGAKVWGRPELIHKTQEMFTIYCQLPACQLPVRLVDWQLLGEDLKASIAESVLRWDVCVCGCVQTLALILWPLYLLPNHASLFRVSCCCSCCCCCCC